jgi:hypothetical protein
VARRCGCDRGLSSLFARARTFAPLRVVEESAASLPPDRVGWEVRAAASLSARLARIIELRETARSSSLRVRPWIVLPSLRHRVVRVPSCTDHADVEAVWMGRGALREETALRVRRWIPIRLSSPRALTPSHPSRHC